MKIQKQKIVLIEDDVALGNSISELLILDDFSVSWFQDGVEALIYLKNHIPDIVISDLMMPLMNGEELYLNVRKNNKLDTIPFVIITANIDDEQGFQGEQESCLGQAPNYIKIFREFLLDPSFRSRNQSDLG